MKSVVHEGSCEMWHYEEPYRRPPGDCTCGLTELLAACERKES